MQVNLNSAAKERADIAITALNNKIKKIDEIESNTNNLFLESKSALAELTKCISELDKSGKGGFTYDTMPAWAVAMNNELLDKYTKSMLSKGRLNEDFVKKFSNLTIAEMTPVEKAVYNKYTDFLLFDAKPEDMNKVVKHYYKRTIDGVLERKKSADELVAALNLKMNIHCMTSPKDVDSRTLERCTILSVALTRSDAYKIGDITLKDGHYHYKYKKYRYSDSNNASPITSQEEYTTEEVSSTPTLGADNGIAIAYALAILDSDDIKHPALEVVITTDEEDGMSGVANLDFDEFDGKTLINLDTEEYGEVYVSSAGGTRTETKFIFETKKIGNGYTPISIEVKGLSGGHSGAEIHKNLGNSIKILSEVLYHLSKRYEMSLIHIDGGGKVNAIPREAVAEIAVKLDGDSIDEFKKLAELAFENILKDFKVSDKSPILAIEEIEEKNLGISLGDTLNIINFLHEVPNGVLEMSKHIEGLVETSINIGFISTEIVDGNVKIRIKSLARSMANDPLNKLVEEVTDLTRKHDANIKIAASNPSWEYKEDSKIRELIAKSFKEITGNEPVIKAIHAGLECGVFTQNIKGADVVSIGPNIYGAHTPEERMDIKSVGETWEWLLKILENYNIKED